MLRNGLLHRAFRRDKPLAALAYKVLYYRYIASTRRYAMTLLLALALFASPLLADSTGEWRSYGATAASTKYAPLDQIDATNFAQLEIAWTWASADQPILDAHPEIWTMVFEGTPLQVGDRLYVSTSLNLVVSLDATSGKTIWTYDPGTWRSGTPANVGLVHRGVSYWEDGDDRRIIFGTGDAYLIALNADTGQPIQSFGTGGRVDLTKGLRRPIERELYAVTSPPVICGDVAIVGAVVLDAFAVGRPPDETMPPGDVRGFDVRTGAQKWVFETIPQDRCLWQRDLGRRLVEKHRQHQRLDSNECRSRIGLCLFAGQHPD